MSPRRQALTFATIGIASTLVYAALYALLRATLSPQGANAVALVVTAFANTAANRALTFGVVDGVGFWRDQLAGAGALAAALAITGIAIAALHVVAPRAGVGAELAVLTGANVAATLTRFYVLRLWFERHRRLVLARRRVTQP